MDLTDARTRMARWFTDTCRISNPGAGPTFDPETFTDVVVAGDGVYEGACRGRSSTTTERAVDIAGRLVSLRSCELWLPWDTLGIAVDQIVDYLTSNDPYLAGREFRVVDVQGGSDNVYRHVVCEETLTSAEGVTS